MTKPSLPPEPPPSLAEKANEVLGLEAALGKDAAYQAVWTGPRADLNAFLSDVSQMLASGGGAPLLLMNTLKAKKLQDGAVKLFLVFSRVGKFPDDFMKKLSVHLDATKAEPYAGTWSTFTRGGPTHDYSCLAAWARPEDAALLREHIAAKKDGAGPFGWSGWAAKGAPARPWLVDEGAALDRLAILTKLTPDELARRESLRAVVKKEAASKAEMARAVQASAATIFSDYEANEVSADEKYKSKKLVVTGNVAGIDKGGLTGEAIIVKLSTSNQFMSIYANMEDEEKAKAAKLAKGDAVKLFCTGGAMKVLGLVPLHDCTMR